MRALRSVVSLSVGSICALGSMAILLGCGVGDTRQVNAPPPQAPPDVTASGSPSAGSARGASSATGAASAESFRQELVAGQRQIDKVLGSLRALTDPSTTDLRAAYDNYSNELSRMEEHAEKTRREANAMRDARSAYFDKWEEKVSEIDNPTIRATAEERRNKMRASHERIARSTMQARDSYEPFMRDLQDARKFLGEDLSKQSVSLLGDVQKKALASGATVKQKLGEVITELDVIDASAR